MLDGFDFEDDLGSLAESENEQVKAPPPKQNLKDIFSEDSDQEKPKSTIDKSKSKIKNLLIFQKFGWNDYL